MFFEKDFGFSCPFGFVMLLSFRQFYYVPLDMMQVSIYTKFVVIDVSVLSWLMPPDFMLQTWFSCCFHMTIRRYL